MQMSILFLISMTMLDGVYVAFAKREISGRRNRFFDNTLISSFVLGKEHGVRSSIVCLSRCLEIVNCVSFFYQKHTSLCQTHGVVYESVQHAEIYSNTRYYTVCGAENSPTTTEATTTTLQAYTTALSTEHSANETTTPFQDYTTAVTTEDSFTETTTTLLQDYTNVLSTAVDLYPSYIKNYDIPIRVRIDKTGTLTWAQAERLCEDEGARLVTLDTNSKFEFLKSVIISSPVLNKANAIYHVGASDLASEGQWKWKNGATLSRNSNLWCKALGQPDDSNFIFTTQDVAAMWNDPVCDFTMDDVWSFQTGFAICEIPF